MSSGAQRWERAQRLDAAGLVEELYAQTGVRLVVEGPCSGGQVGAAFVRWMRGPDVTQDGTAVSPGRRSVLKWRPHSRMEDLRRGPLAAQEVSRAAGIPAPATQLVAQVGHAVVMVQELLPGAALDAKTLDENILDQALRINERQAGLLRDRPDVPQVQLYLTDDGPGYCLHEPLRQYNARTAALERRIVAVTPASEPGHDVVHLDFHPGNLLARDGTVTGLVDWDGAGRGHRGLDLVTLRFAVHQETVSRRLDEILDGLPSDVLAGFWAHMSLRLVDWAIRHHTAGDVERYLDLAEQRL
ncbi:aminoglycoside phosphotransferase family protein [Kineosporia sp. J2-2]|uniref:Aminoglycoside phosphotransferase family protein n=1 Tax=Kineosporia corallincola TaxID=2835133 RepID=A0ABS5TJM3_9ACTN|nr:phosphotransferase [Kineosporia corallincola]MBT0771301.1 aminoglycoside phosphotransferase family protein [Kineosporia corallincola]